MKVKKVPQNQRLNFLPKLFYAYYLTGENFVYGFMEKNAKNYTGGYYEFMKCENGALYMKPDDEYFLSLSNHFSDVVSADNCGIIATLYALNAMIHKAYVKGHGDVLHYLIKKYNELNDYVRTLDDASYSLIKRAID